MTALDDRPPSELLDLMGNEQLQQLVHTITANVIARRTGAEPWQVERIVVEELVAMRDARITQFLPILVTRAALDRLRQEAADQEVAP